jgi:hypothetical protein
MGSMPNPYLSIRYGVDNSPNACNLCHRDKAPEWALEHLKDWGQDRHMLDVPLHLTRSSEADTVHGRPNPTAAGDGAL